MVPNQGTRRELLKCIGLSPLLSACTDRALLTKGQSSTASGIDAQLARAVAQIELNLIPFGHNFPAEATTGGRYEVVGAGGPTSGANQGWCTGFWAGMVWLGLAATRKESFKECAAWQVQSFARRIRERSDTQRYELGFLYSPACVLGWRLFNDPVARDAALAAASLLAREVYLESARILPSPTSTGRAQGRTIIDTSMSLPLLLWAAAETNDTRLAEVAEELAAQLAANLIRDDGTTFHVFFFDPRTGAALRGDTSQGFSATSAWSRGQAWAIYAFSSVYRYLRQAKYLDIAERLFDAYVQRLPDDFVPYWDLDVHGPGEPRDSSAGSIAVCGMLELSKHSHRSAEIMRVATATMNELAKSYSAPIQPRGGILLHGARHVPAKRSVDESNLWGDYFYVEALYRLTHDRSFSSW